MGKGGSTFFQTGSILKPKDLCGLKNFNSYDQFHNNIHKLVIAFLLGQNIGTKMATPALAEYSYNYSSRFLSEIKMCKSIHPLSVTNLKKNYFLHQFLNKISQNFSLFAGGRGFSVTN